MDAAFSETSTAGAPALITIHGFRVQSYGERVSPGFKRGLRRLSERGFHDPACVVVKTPSGPQSGITHAGGRYVHPEGTYRTEVMREMRSLGMEPPSPPFLVAPGEFTLYHEWGHHVDRTWSRDHQDVVFSFRWFSRFYRLFVQPPCIAHPVRVLPADCAEIQPIESELNAADAVVLWWHASSELFADLFEDWMRGENKVHWDRCEPRSLNADSRWGHGRTSVRIELLPRLRADDVRAETYSLFTAGIRSAVDLPPIRPGLFGPYTDDVIGRLRDVLALARTGRL